MRELSAQNMKIKDEKTLTVCVLDASTFAGFWFVNRLVVRGYRVHAAITPNGEEDVIKNLRALERTADGLKVFSVDTLDYCSILEAIRHCHGVFCCLDSPDKYDENTADLEVRGAINVVEACAHTASIRKIVFTSSLTAAVWTPNISSQKDVDERTWSDQEFCTKMKLWYALAKTLSEKAAWALATDRMLDIVSINAGLVLGPDVARLNPIVSMSYLQGAEQMYKNGVLATVDVNFLADVHIRAFEDGSTRGRYFCFDRIVESEADCLQLARSFSPLISLPCRHSNRKESEEKENDQRLRSNKLSKLIIED